MTTDTILTIKEVKLLLRVSDSWVYKKAKAGIIPHFKIGGTIRFSQKDIIDWLQRHRVEGRQKFS